MEGEGEGEGGSPSIYLHPAGSQRELRGGSCGGGRGAGRRRARGDVRGRADAIGGVMVVQTALGGVVGVLVAAHLFGQPVFAVSKASAGLDSKP